MRGREHFVYWLFDADDTCLYVGMTRQPERRWQQHKADKPWIGEVATRRMAGPFDIETARILERQQQEDLDPVYDMQKRESGLLLKPGGIERLRQLGGYASNRALADAIGINQSNLSRISQGRSQPGVPFIAGVMNVFGSAVCFDVALQIAESA